MRRRLERINELLRDELSQLMLRNVKDPRLCGIISITKVVSSPDLRYATVFVSVLGTDDERRSSLQGLTAASTFMRRELSSRLDLRRVPDLHFQADTSIEASSQLLQLMNDLRVEADPAPA